MTYKRALREVAMLAEQGEEPRIRFLSMTSDIPTLRIVCGWYLHEREAFNELVELAGAPAPDASPGYAMSGATSHRTGERSVRADGLVDFYLSWTTHQDAADRFGGTRKKMQARIQSAVKRRGLLIERRMGVNGLEWRVIVPDQRAQA